MRQRLPMWAPRVAIAAALVALIAWSFWQRWRLLAASPFPLGVDGYFYAIELRALLERGALHYPASPLAFYLLAPFAALTDPITGAKLGAALLGAAIAAPAYAVGARLAGTERRPEVPARRSAAAEEDAPGGRMEYRLLGGGRGAGLVAAVLATTSTGSAYLSVEFVKNGVGLTVALTALWLVLRATERPSRARIAAALAGLACAYATHKMAGAIAVVVAIPAALAAAGARGVLRGRRLLIACAGLVLLAGVALALGAAFPERFLSARDAALVRDLVSTTPRWSAPALASPTGGLALGYDALLGLGLAVVAVLARLGARWRRRPDDRPREVAPPAAVTVAAWPILVLAIAIGLPFLDVTDRQGLGFRLRVAAFVPAALAAALAARAVLAHLSAGWRDAVLAAVAAVLALARQPGARLDGMVVTHPALVTAAQALNGRVPAGATLVVPERHIAFLVAWYTGAAIAMRPDHVPPARRWRLLTMHFIGEGSALDRQLIAARAEPSLVPPLGVHPRHPNGLVLVAEPTWTWILEQLPPSDRARLSAWPTI